MTMGFGQAVTTCVVGFAEFSGRASRSEFWWFCLFVFLMSLAAEAIGGQVFPADPAAAHMVPAVLELIFFVPFLAAGARRLHDTGRSGWWLLLILTGAGTILLVIWWALGSERERNIHGAPPARAGP